MNGSTETAAPYRVLARAYRPTRFAELIGQDAMVRTLTNAIASGRLAHAFILTGTRGVGKTTTARIIARALNCIGADGQGGPTAEPCGVCEHCAAIAEDRHIDVIEMDAASRTGVDDIRELIDGVLYRPVTARCKVYIIDEVHMLSRNAFNALLKTLEEPPEHVKFVFATTETRRVPVTVLSRCQRFDLRRVDAPALQAHLREVAARERVEAADDALALIVRAAEGSVRDALSLLDQAIAHAEEGPVEAGPVRLMLGLADRQRVADLFEALIRGRAPEALAVFDALYEAGADPAVVLQDLLEFAHFLTRLAAAPESAAAGAVSDVERERARALAAGLSVPALARAWQILLKGLSEARVASGTREAAEMVLIRLAYAADLPTPAELVRSMESPGGSSGAPPAPAAFPEGPSPPARTAPEAPEAREAAPPDFESLVELFAARREEVLRAHLAGSVRLVDYAPGALAFRPGPGAPADLASALRRKLEGWTGRRWSVEAVEAEDAAPSLQEQQERAAAAERDAAIAHPTVQAALEIFPGARVEEVRAIEPAPGPESGDRSP